MLQSSIFYPKTGGRGFRLEKEQLTQLVIKCQNGDMEAMEQLMLYAYTPVSFQCRKMMKNEQDAEDITQDVLITLFEKINTLADPSAFRKWITTIASNRCLNALGNPHKEYQIPEDEDGNSMLDTIETLDDQIVPDKALDNAETCRMINEVVQSLPEAQRICTLMFYFNEMSVKEIAESLSVPENTVKSRLNYARKAIKEKVLDYEKQGVKLYSVSPVVLLWFFLRKAMDEETDRKKGAVLVRKILPAGSKAAAGALGGTAQAVGTGAVGVGSGVNISAAAGAAAVLTAAGLSGSAEAADTEGTPVPEAAAETARTIEAVPAGQAVKTAEREGIRKVLPGFLSGKAAVAAAAAVAVAAVGIGSAAAMNGSFGQPPEPVVIEEEHFHAYSLAEEVLPGCESAGYITYLCSCGDTVEEELAALEHLYLPDENSDDPNQFLCQRCGEIMIQENTDCEHIWEAKILPATCVEDGLQQSICTVCGNIQPDSTQVLPKNPDKHNWGSWYTVQSPTETDPGVEMRRCSVCGREETNELPVLEHVHVYEVKTVGEGTCVNPATQTRVCTACGEVGEETTIAEHVPVTDTMPPNCTSGTMTTVSCKLCYYLIEQSMANDRNPENHIGFNLTSSKPANCSSPAVKTYTCGCGATKTETEGSPDPDAHSLKAYNTVNGSCKYAGYTSYRCEYCGGAEHTEFHEIDPEAHVLGVYETVNATCSKEGYQRYRCNFCRGAERTEILPIDPNAHINGATISRYADCQGPKIMLYTCIYCGHQREEVVGEADPNVHSSYSGSSNPSCTEDVYYDMYCSYCGAFVKQGVSPASGHNMQSKVIAPTETSQGYTHHYCANYYCSYAYDDNFVPALAPAAPAPEQPEPAETE